MELKLSDLKKGERGRIKGFCDDELYLKLMEMGFIVGEALAVVETGFYEDPMAIKICGYIVSLRRSEASAILIDKITD